MVAIPPQGPITRYFYDTEFIEDGSTIDLISIGVVCEDGREYYAISSEFNPDRAVPWVRRNVLDKLPGPADKAWRSRRTIRDELAEFFAAGVGAPDLWAWYAAYDHVVLAQLWGAMPALPRNIPRFTKELRQLWEDAGYPTIPDAGPEAHNALADARVGFARWQAITAVYRSESSGA
ncbi:polyadenylate-specific 3'-exoribonuclease AS [Nakamurella antarctica]|uniref:3'-5' exoribonuclease n=1 Tax=Nakamurella antarctica TaxID=1902245 RepID=A0A3G8ZUV0_9ACTN|nr:polyadenylate-specific 3'-exoribonuclease AS [Nakamurella antarctica]AZI57796.1 polyadenylate-specific 3'-exoribonuclease AS [Nakamurella antarctica]